MAGALQRQVSDRAHVLAARENKQAIVNVSPFNGPLPGTVHHQDLEVDPSFFVNQAVAREFGIAAVRLRQ